MRYLAELIVKGAVFWAGIIGVRAAAWGPLTPALSKKSVVWPWLGGAIFTNLLSLACKWVVFGITSYHIDTSSVLWKRGPGGPAVGAGPACAFGLTLDGDPCCRVAEKMISESSSLPWNISVSFRACARPVSLPSMYILETN